VAGFYGDADRLGVGAAAGVDLLEREVTARVGDGAQLYATDGILVQATSVDRVDSIVAGAILPELQLLPDLATLAITGSLSFVFLDSATHAGSVVRWIRTQRDRACG
jgi:hypothetical protein